MPKLLTLLLASLFLLAACGGDDNSDPSDGAKPAEPSKPAGEQAVIRCAP